MVKAATTYQTKEDMLFSFSKGIARAGRTLFGFLSEHKGLVLILALIALTAVEAFAAGGGANPAGEGLTKLNEAGKGAETTVIKTIQNWRWIFALLPFGLGFFMAFRIKGYLEQKDEQSNGQTEPKASRYGKIFASFIAGIVVCFILYGIFGSVFAGKEFMQMWDYLVMDFWKQLVQ
ncbi:hypothetical protein [Campylobacter sp. RM16188]|uniref:hypothetical protein n=1 Tax=Campylobacter sp. RM16188 TaxID=1705725 RepID=UPI0015533D09|nr:hypothetical protein [Campylobacter sp. RM16188]